MAYVMLKESDNMGSRPLVIFDLDGVRFGLDIKRVRETVWLPELTPMEEAPPWIVGIFSLRGRIVPVVDLHLRFGHAPQPYTPDNQVVVLEMDQQLMGVIVSEVREVIELASDAMQPPPQFTLAPNPDPLVAGEARVNDDLITLLDMTQLSQLPQDMAQSVAEKPDHHFCPQATPEEHAIYRARARALMEATVGEDGAQLGLAVVELDNEYFGIELEMVQEFCTIVQPSPIPCCPPHILGTMSLRGNLLTLLDLRTALNLPQASPEGNTKAVIARFGEQMVGVTVDDVHDVIYLRKKDLQAPPPALREQHGTEIKGTAPYADKMMAVLDLTALLARPEWLVNENV
jgi:purine-binding chemotaxis protein CheW